ncbi:MAG: hypothetical protein ACETWT_13480 [Thermodesulfobacteriota bacterium]
MIKSEIGNVKDNPHPFYLAYLAIHGSVKGKIPENRVFIIELCLGFFSNESAVRPWYAKCLC